RAQKLLFRSQLGLALRGDLADQDVACHDFGTDIHDAGFVQLVQRGLTDVRNVRSDFFRAELGVTGHTGQFLDVDGGQAVFLNHALGQADGVFEVEAVPRHERNAQVLTQRQLAHVGGRTVGHDVATRNHVTLIHQRTLVDAGVLVGAGVLGEVVDVDAGFAGFDFGVVDAHHDAAGIDRVDHAATTGDHADTGVTGDVALHAGTHQRLVGAQGRHSLTLHVRTHQC